MSETHHSARIVVAGAGLAGALMAIYLARAGHEVLVYERRSDPRAKGFIGGRSINLALSTRGIAALEKAGLADKVLADAIPMRGRMMHSAQSELTFQPYSARSDRAINSVSRGGLNLTLLEVADSYDNVSLHFDQRCEDIDFENTTAIFTGPDGQTHRVSADAIIGADGAFSAVRTAMQKTDRFDYSQSYLEHGYKELHIPPEDDGDFAMEPNALHIWPRGGSMMIALPNKDRSFTCTLFWPYEGDHAFAAIREESDVLPFFRKHYPDAVPLMPTLVEDYQRNPVSSLVTIRCWPWTRNLTLILGDAAHAIVPFYGQGMNCAFEDCAALDVCLRQHPGDIPAAFHALEELRKRHADAIADLALDNFIEMRDKVGSKAFLLKKKGEKLLSRLFPKRFLPLYDMVSFSTIPYDDARRRARAQSSIVRAAVSTAALIILLVAVAIIF
ncbi:MAG: NAD(P)/FAD-dependent oxidoreductase [Planctomycetota bacterium]|nr:NAD(P)/FAD-dependent oxidoreductase [Planctomycetota bacterium]